MSLSVNSILSTALTLTNLGASPNAISDVAKGTNLWARFALPPATHIACENKHLQPTGSRVPVAPKGAV